MLELRVRFGKGNGFSVGFARKVNAIVSGECTRRRVPIASLATTLRRKSLQWRGAPLVRARLAVAREAGALPETNATSAR